MLRTPSTIAALLATGWSCDFGHAHYVTWLVCQQKLLKFWSQNRQSNHWQIQNFLEVGCQPSGDANIQFCQSFPKTAWNVDLRDASKIYYVDPPLPTKLTFKLPPTDEACQRLNRLGNFRSQQGRLLSWSLWDLSDILSKINISDSCSLRIHTIVSGVFSWTVKIDDEGLFSGVSTSVHNTRSGEMLLTLISVRVVMWYDVKSLKSTIRLTPGNWLNPLKCWPARFTGCGGRLAWLLCESPTCKYTKTFSSYLPEDFVTSCNFIHVSCCISQSQLEEGQLGNIQCIMG